MQILPAIDIEGGRVARSATAARQPMTVARELRAAGAIWLHVVDMDRAFGRGANDVGVEAIASMGGVKVQLGGGTSDTAYVRAAMEWGAARITVSGGFLAGDKVGSEGLDPQRLALNLDMRGRRPVDRATDAVLDRTDGDLVDAAVALGVTTVVYRDLDRDGTLAGADIDGAARLVERGAHVILAGGVASLAELAAASEAGVAGVIIGTALHAARFTLLEALAWSG